MPKRILLLMSTTMTLALLAFGGVALADLVNCVINEPCVGTPQSDTLTGTDGQDEMFGLGGDDYLPGGGEFDTMHGGPGQDHLSGDGLPTTSVPDTGDTLYGESGPDNLHGDGGANSYFGGTGNDTIDAEWGDVDGATPEDVDAGPGRDRVIARDGHPDNIQCGSGADVVVRADLAATDAVAANCEQVDAQALP